MMKMEEEFLQDDDNLSLEDIDLSLLLLNSPPYDFHSSSFFYAASPEISPLKRYSPLSDESDRPKRRKISPLRFTYPETQSSSIEEPTRNPNLSAGKASCSYASPVSEKQETTPFGSKKTMKKNRVDKEMNRDKETNYESYEKKQKEKVEEEDRGEGMRIERSGDGFVIRLKCRCKQAFRVLFSDHHLYFKPL